MNRVTAGGRSWRAAPWSALVVAGLAVTAACRQGADTEARMARPPPDAASEGSPLVTARRLFERAEVLRESQDLESCREALDLYLAALATFEGSVEGRAVAETYNRLGRLHRKCFEEKRAAIGYYRRSGELFGELGDLEQQGYALNQVGRLHLDLGELELAIEHFDRALSLGRDLGDRELCATALFNRAVALRYRGEVEEVLAAYDQTLEVYEELGSPKELGTIFNNRGRYYQALGQSRAARADLERALVLGRRIKSPSLQAMALTGLGQIHADAGELDLALERLEEASSWRQAVGRRRGRAVTLRSLGEVYEKLGRHQAAFEAHSQALGIFLELEARREVAGARAALGRLAAIAGRTDEALALFRAALKLYRQLGDTAGEIDTLSSLARAARARGDLDAAQAHVEAALAGIEELRDRAPSLDLRRSYFAAQQDHWDFYVELLMERHRSVPDAGYDRLALLASERSRARSWLELLAEDRQRGVEPALRDRERNLKRQLAMVERERLSRLDRNAPSAVVDALTKRSDELLRQLRAVRGEIHGELHDRRPGSASLEGPVLEETEVSSVEEIQEVLDPGSLLLEYHLGAEKSYAWAVTAGSMTSFELPPRAQIEAAARRARELIEPARERQLHAAGALALERLGELALAPVAEVLAGHRRVLIAGHGALRYIPFAALPVPGSAARPAPPLVAEHELVRIPSGSALMALRREIESRLEAPLELAVIADPVFDRDDPRFDDPRFEAAAARAIPASENAAEPRPTRGGRLQRLPHSGQEAAAILRLAEPGASMSAVGFAATREAAMDPALGRYRIVHLATHGQIDSERPELSRLVFSRFDARGQPRDGILWAYEIFELELAAELVVLSACETALGQEIRGEGWVGLAQGFFHAGAASVLVSLWRVDDEATAALMTIFYRRLENAESPAAALREAQLAVRDHPRWRAPFYWAGFVLQGEWR